MLSRERMQLILDHKEADRVPRYSFFSPSIRKRFKSIFSISDDFDLAYVFDHDFVLVFIGYPSPWVVNNSTMLRKEGEVFYDEWGIKYKTVYYNEGYYPTIIENPIKVLDDYEKYTFPDPLGDKNFDLLGEVVKKYKKDKYIFAGDVSTLFEGSWFLRGMENFLIDLYKDPEYVEILLDKFVDYKIKAGLKALSLGADVLWLGDDIGMQDRMIIPPEFFRKYLKPKYAKIIQELREKNREAKIAFHTCGFIEPIIEDFIDIGVDILNSLQPVNDLKMIKKKYGKNLVFWGGIDIQEVLPIGDAGDVIKEVKEKLEILAPGGGYIIMGSNEIQYSDKVMGNLFTYYWALDKFSKYPINF